MGGQRVGEDSPHSQGECITANASILAFDCVAFNRNYLLDSKCCSSLDSFHQNFYWELSFEAKTMFLMGKLAECCQNHHVRPILSL
jgi:hypothetical protein